MIKIIIGFSVLLLTACEANNALIVGMQASFYEQFTGACQGQQSCINTADQYLVECFDRGLASNTIKAEAGKKRSLNEAHIKKIQQCMQNKTGTDYWRDVDMVNRILELNV